MLSISSQIKNAEALVKMILRDNPETRGDDLKLLLKVWEFQGLKFNEKQKYMFTRVMNPETIRRTRQKIQELGLYRPTPEIYQARLDAGERFKAGQK